MANDALAQSGIDIGLSGEADYDAVYAAVTATERGRRFLTELADRNRRAETDALMAAIVRVEAAVRGDAPANQSTNPPEIDAAAERLADIALELRERGADAGLCDALDVAVREICMVRGSDAKNLDTVERVPLADGDRQAAADRSNPEPVRQTAEDAGDADAPSSGETFDMPLRDSAKFAEAAAALAASLTALSEGAEAASEPPTASSVPTPIPPHDYEPVSAPQPAAAPEQGPRWHIEAPDFVFHRPQLVSDNHTAEVSGRPSRPQALLPGLQLLPSPDEDPAELFEPSPKRVAVLPSSVPAASAAKPTPTPLASAVSAAAQAIRTANQPSRSPTGPAVRPMPRPAPVSPLAALRGLTEEELIALFG
jgi:hypothetical protein